MKNVIRVRAKLATFNDVVCYLAEALKTTQERERGQLQLKVYDVKISIKETKI